LKQALDGVGYHGRLVLGSWYGEKEVTLDLGGRFHRSHIQIISSQVSRAGGAMARPLGQGAPTGRRLAAAR
jgi:hypothetical protein